MLHLQGEKEEISRKAKKSAKFYEWPGYSATPLMLQSCAFRHTKILCLPATSLREQARDIANKNER